MNHTERCRGDWACSTALALLACGSFREFAFGTDRPVLEHHRLLAGVGVFTLFVVASMVSRAREQ